MEKATEFFDTWVQMQEEVVKHWLAAAQELPQTLLEMEVFKSSLPDSPASELFNANMSCLKDLSADVVHMQQLGTEVMKDTVARASGTSNVFMKLYELWHPLFQAVQDRVMDVEAYGEVLEPQEYSEIMDQVFGLGPATATEVIHQTTKITEALCCATQEYGRPWAQAMQKNGVFMPELAEGRPDTFLHIFHNLFSAFDNTVGKVFHIPAVGKDREKIGLILRGLDDLVVYNAKYTEFQQRIYVTGIKALEKVLHAVAQRIRSGHEIRTLNELFELWLDINEQEYFHAFRTKEFSMLQGELLGFALKVRRQFHKLMELNLYEYPIALRSEMDDTYKTLYELKKKVRNLERKISDRNVKEAAA